MMEQACHKVAERKKESTEGQISEPGCAVHISEAYKSHGAQILEYYSDLIEYQNAHGLREQTDYNACGSHELAGVIYFLIHEL
jgi:hypothetical protein